MNTGKYKVIKLLGLGKFVSNGIHKAWLEGKYITRRKTNKDETDSKNTGNSKWVVELIDKKQEDQMDGL